MSYDRKRLREAEQLLLKIYKDHKASGWGDANELMEEMRDFLFDEDGDYDFVDDE